MKASHFPPIHEELIFPEDAHIYAYKQNGWRIRYYDPDLGRMVFEALGRYVWRLFNGPIPDGWVIHHKNADAWDNHPDNLEAMSWSEHSKFHRLHPECRSEMYVKYYADNPGKEHAKYERYVAPKRKAQRLAERNQAA